MEANESSGNPQHIISGQQLLPISKKCFHMGVYNIQEGKSVL